MHCRSVRLQVWQVLPFLTVVFLSSFPLDNDTWPLSCDTDYEDVVIADNSAQLVFSTDFSVTKYGFHIVVQSGLKLVVSPHIHFCQQADWQRF